MREHLELSHRRFARDFGEAPFAETDRQLRPAPAKAALAGGEAGNPLKTRKQPHEATAY